MPLDFSKIGQPCELHELTGCSICSGLDKQLQAEEEQETAPQWLAPGVVAAGWPGKCAGCGADYPAGTPIRHSSALGGFTPTSGECC